MTDTAKTQKPTGAPASAAPEDGTHAFTLDGREVRARKGELLIAAAERAGTYIPRFCYHPRMEPVGMCRMCLVEVEGPRGATLQPACFIEAGEGMVVDTTSEKVKKAQDGVLEFLLANHPLDCPVCDKGGECPLQDQTLAYGPGESRFVEEKRHFEKPIAISDLVLLDRERCIQCARCTRFASEVAGEAQIDFAGRGEAVEVATFPTEPFSSYFSGNTVQICPVGALTATPYRFTARPWDLDQVESTCTACSVGCRVAVQSSQNRLTRLLGIDSEPVNHGWLCDKGRFAYESVNGDEIDAGPLPSELADEAVDVAPATASQVVSLGVSRGQFLGEVRETGRFEHGRLTEPRVRKEGELVPVSWGEALAAAAAGIAAAKSAGGAGAVALIGGARVTNESAYAWAKLAKGIIGTDSVDAQLGDGLPAELVLGLPRATIDEACAAPVLLTLAGDLREELPVLFLRLRESVLAGRTQLVEIAPIPTALSALAAATLRVRPGDAAAVARAITGDAAAAGALGTHPEGAAVTPAQLEAARGLLAAHPGGEGVVIVAGRPSYAESGEVAADAVRVLATALPKATFLPALRRGNVFGALDMGLAPGILPGRVSLDAGRERFTAAWGSVPAAAGLSTADILASMAGERDGGDGRSCDGRARARPAGRRPAGRLPRPRRGREGAVGRALRRGRHGPPVRVGRRACRRGAALRGDARAGGHHDQHRGTGEPARPQALGARLRLARLDDRRRARRRPRVGPRPRQRQRPVRRAGPDGAGLRRADAAGPALRRGARRHPGAAHRERGPPRRRHADRPGGPARRRVGGAPGRAAPRGHRQQRSRRGARRRQLGSPPPLLAWTGAGGTDPLPIPKADSYSLRLVSGRRLYDAGSSVTGSPSLTPLVPTLVARANPYDLDRLGADTGDRVKVRSARGELILAAESDEGVPRGVVAIDFNVPGGESAPPNAVATLIDSRQLVTDVRLESV